MAYEISGQSDTPEKNKIASRGNDDHPTTTDQNREAGNRAEVWDGEDSETNPDTLKAANQ